MRELFSSIAKGGWTFTVGWILPSAIAISAFAILVYPSDQPGGTADFLRNQVSVTEQAVLILGSAVFLAVLLSAVSNVLYRILEGFYGPRWLRSKRATAQLRKKNKFIQRVGDDSLEPTTRGRALEHLTLFPPDPQLQPTRLGNAIRALERYGVDRFRIDSQALWTELFVSAPKALRDEHDRARAGVDIFVCLIYLSLAFGLAAIGIGLSTSKSSTLRPLLVGGTELTLIPIWYGMAVTSTGYWLSTVRALVNFGRARVASGLGLELPLDLDEEREMWRSVTRIVLYEREWQDDDTLRHIAAHRMRTTIPISAEDAGEEEGDGDGGHLLDE